jgi:hypothetical protein
MEAACPKINYTKHTRKDQKTKGRTTGLLAEHEAYQHAEEVKAETGECLRTLGTSLSHPVPYHFDTVINRTSP